MLDRDKIEKLAAWYAARYGDDLSLAEWQALGARELAQQWGHYQAEHCPGCDRETSAVPGSTNPLIVITGEGRQAHHECLIHGLPDPALDPDDGPLRWLCAAPADAGLAAYYGFGAQAVQLYPAANPRYSTMVIATGAHNADWMSKRLQSGMRGGWPVYLTRVEAEAVAAQMAALR